MAKSNPKTQQDRLNKLKRGKNSAKKNKNRPKKNPQTVELQARLNEQQTLVATLREQIIKQSQTIAKLEAEISQKPESISQADNLNPREADLASFGEAPTKDSPNHVEAGALEAKLTVITQEMEDWKSKCLRTLADLQNLQKQTELDIQQAKKRTKKSTVFSLLEFLNTLNISFSYTPETEDKKVLGFIATLRSAFEKVITELANSGIEILRVAPGDDFDPQYMNILNTQVNGAESENKVVQVVGLGLRIDDQLVQPASVIIK